MRVAAGCVGLNNVKIELPFIYLTFTFISIHSSMLQNAKRISCECVNNSFVFLCLLTQICSYIQIGECGVWASEYKVRALKGHVIASEYYILTPEYNIK